MNYRKKFNNPLIFTREFKEQCPAPFSPFWQGEVFYHNRNYGMQDSLALAKLFKFPLQGIENYFAGDFCLVTFLPIPPQKIYKFPAK